MTPLCELAHKHGTDKFGKHNYTSTYYEAFKDRTDRVKRVLEIGIAKGRSLRMWEEFFPNASIYGFDRNPICAVNTGRIKSIIGDQKDIPVLKAAAKVATAGREKLDVIIDDGNHHWSLQLSTAEALLPFLADDGIYVIEDVMERIRKGVRVDDPKFIRNRLPPGYATDVIRTGENVDDVLLFIRRSI